ncbi:MAG TPA: helix-turn-helix transcriptional regulator [Candidatus Paceibacterota bacterium]
MSETRLSLGEIVVLEVLRRGTCQHGFQIKKSVDEILQHDRSTAGIYMILRRLEKKSLASSKWEDGRNPEGARRRLYHLTKEGRKTCDKMREVLVAILAG